MENTHCLNIDKDCQVEIFLTVKNEVKPFICNRYIYVDKKVCDAEVQTEITSNSKIINYNRKTKDQVYNTIENNYVQKETITEKKYFNGFQLLKIRNTLAMFN